MEFCEEGVPPRNSLRQERNLLRQDIDTIRSTDGRMSAEKGDASIGLKEEVISSFHTRWCSAVSSSQILGTYNDGIEVISKGKEGAQRGVGTCLVLFGPDIDVLLDSVAIPTGHNVGRRQFCKLIRILYNGWTLDSTIPASKVQVNFCLLPSSQNNHLG